jgi:hypothetical protein
MRLAPLVLAIGLITPQKSFARGRTVRPDPTRRPGQAQARRRARREAPRAIASPSGRHVLEIADGVVALNGLPVRATTGAVHVVGDPVWRADGGAVAWIERSLGETRLVVLPAVAVGSPPLAWVLPWAATDDRVHWAGAQRVVVGPVVVEPRAVASWTD